MHFYILIIYVLVQCPLNVTEVQFKCRGKGRFFLCINQSYGISLNGISLQDWYITGQKTRDVGKRMMHFYCMFLQLIT